MDRGLRPSLDELAQDAKVVLDDLQIQSPVVVFTLSYGAAPGLSFCKLYPQYVSRLIMTSPLAVPGDNYATANAIASAWENYLQMFPVYGPIWADMTKENISEYYASTLVHDNRQVQGYFPDNVSDDQLREGLVSMIRAGENFDLRSFDFSGLPQTDFILAGAEVAPRLKNQIDGYKAMKAQGKHASLTIVQNAPHAITSAAPEDMANLDEHFLTGAGEDDSVLTVNPADHQLFQLTDEQQPALFKNIEESAAAHPTVQF
jgi:pimeloyl-ACP methyl ester carboxylesterase